MSVIIPILKSWWWLILPVVLYFPARFLYFWWLNWDVWYEEKKWTILEIIPPAEILKPFRAMEDIFNRLWAFYDFPDWRKKWCEGEPTFGGGLWFSFELLSFEGEVHFYLRIPKDSEKMVESIIHTHYPETEIFETNDYVQNVPADIPNKEYDFWGEDYVLVKDYVYPIRTYKFFEIKPEETKVEKKIDPFSSLMESLVNLKEGEQFWFQIIAIPILDEVLPWTKRGRAKADEIVKRLGKAKDKSIAGETARTVLLKDYVPFEPEKKKEEIIPSEMKLTPGEKQILEAVEDKISKRGFKVSMRSLYIFKRGSQFPNRKTITRAYLSHFGVENLNSMKHWGETKTEVKYFFPKIRTFWRKRDIFERYIERVPAKSPNSIGGTLILNSEELATIFHLPAEAGNLPSGVSRVSFKKGGPPPSIPTGKRE